MRTNVPFFLHSIHTDTLDNMHMILFLVLIFKPISTRELSCHERDYCNGRLIDHRSMIDSELIKIRNCFCDRACFRYGDCCEDIKHIRSIEQQFQYTCVDYMYPFRIRSEPYMPTTMPVWMITTCLSNYEYTQLAINCTNHLRDDFSFSHPPAFIPMTSRQSNLTYRNIYCAQCNNEKMDMLSNWSFQIVCNGIKQNSIYHYYHGLDLTRLLPREAEQCTIRLSYPSSPAVVYPCKHVTVDSCPSSFSGNTTLANQCATINAYRYVLTPHPLLVREHRLYRNEYCLQCHNVSGTLRPLETSCEHQLDDELSIDPKPKTGSRGICRLSILFDPDTLALRSPPSILSHSSSSSRQTHLTTIYPCDSHEVYDYLLHICVMLHDENDWRLAMSFNCSNPVRIRRQDTRKYLDQNDSIIFFSHILTRQHGDFLILFSDSNKLLICGERLSLVYLQHNRLIITLRYTCTISSLIALLIFIIGFSQKSSLHNLPGKCLLMLSISLYASQSMFLASGHLLEHTNRLWCFYSGIAVHLFYLSSFGWLTIIAFDTCITLTRMTRSDASMARNRFILYNVGVWSFALVFVFISVSLHLILPEDNSWSPNYGRILCSISSRRALLAFFLAPVAILILVNIVLFTRTVIAIRCIDKETQLVQCTGGHSRSRVMLFVRLAILMGLHWTFLLICLIFKRDTLWLFFDIINSLPGIYIAIGFLEKTVFIKQFRLRFRPPRSQSLSFGVPTTSTTNSNRRWSYVIRRDDSPNVEVTRRLGDITLKLDNLARRLLVPNDHLSA